MGGWVGGWVGMYVCVRVHCVRKYVRINGTCIIKRSSNLPIRLSICLLSVFLSAYLSVYLSAGGDCAMSRDDLLARPCPQVSSAF